MLEIETVVVSDLEQNCRVLWCSETHEAVIVDPGADAPKILKILKEKNLKCKAIWLTHSHLDHCGAVQPIIDDLQIPLVSHSDEVVLRQSVKVIAQMYGLNPNDWSNCPEPNTTVVEGDSLSFGRLTAKVLFTPGHSPGHISFYFESDKAVFSGDTLFAGSIGRSDLPGGKHEILIKSIEQKLFTLPRDTRVYSGHGAETEIGIEIDSNPFF